MTDVLDDVDLDLNPVQRLTRDLKKASTVLKDAEARFLVDSYYQMQEDRIRAANQVRQLGEEPNEVMTWLAAQTSTLEKQIARALDAYTGAKTVGRWCRSITGIGPIISAGLLAHIDLEPWTCGRVPRRGQPPLGMPPELVTKDACTPQEPHPGGHCTYKRLHTAGHIWSFAGLDPTVKWEKGQKRPWNARLKVLVWKLGESFVKVSGKETDFYGKLYLRRKAIEVAKNNAGDFRELAEESLRTKNFRKDTFARKAYEAGKLPDARIHLRAKRWACKIFLSHYHCVAYRERFGILPPKPYVLTHLGHTDMIQVPNFPWPDEREF